VNAAQNIGLIFPEDTHINLSFAAMATSSKNKENGIKLIEFLTSAIVVIFTVMFIIIIIGTTLAWLISAYDFPFRKFLRWALILPLDIPPYIAAYTILIWN
jgi:ABC-type sulfate transport system permease component